MWKHVLFTLLMFAAVPICPGRAAWGGCSCEPVGLLPVSTLPLSPDYAWVKAPGGYALFDGPFQIGAYLVKDRVYFRLLPGPRWVEADCPAELPPGTCQCPGGCKCPPDNCPCNPKDCPCKKKQEPSPTVIQEGPIFGVEADKVQSGQHILNGREVSREAILSALSDVPKDADRFRLTIIGPDADRKAVLADLKASPELQAATSDILVQDYLPDAWEVKGVGFDTAGSPRIVLQSADGKILHSQPEYDGGAVALAEAIRKAREDYDPKKDPDLRKPAPLPDLNQIVSKLNDVPPAVWLGGIVVLFLLWQKKGGE